MDRETTTLRRVAGFSRYWAAATVSSFGTAVSAVAMPALVITVLHASPLEVGLVSASQVLPYALLGLVIGAQVDRFRRKPLLVWASVGRGVCLGLIPLLWLFGALHLWSLLAVLFVFGTLSVLGFAATQSLLPRVVPRQLLLSANARLDQSDAAAQTAGPALGGAIVSALTAPVAIVIDAVSYFVEAILVSRIAVDEPAPQRRSEVRLGRDIAEGVRWTYRNAVLAPLAASTHLWFVANSAAMTVFAVLALGALGLPALAYGAILAVSGIAMLTGATLAPRLGTRFGAGVTIIASRAAYPFAWAAVALAFAMSRGSAGAGTLALLFVALALHGFAAGTENANEMGLRQTITPDHLLGRVNGTMRSANRSLAALGAIGGGALATVAGIEAALIAVTAVFALAAAVGLCSPLRRAVITEHPVAG